MMTCYILRDVHGITCTEYTHRHIANKAASRRWREHICKVQAVGRQAEMEQQAGRSEPRRRQSYSPIGMTIPRTATVMLLPIR